MANPKYQREQYISRINKVIDYIESHLEKSLTLKELADVACFSPFHFHRTFSSIAGETLNQFINRVRVERAASQLITNPKKSITEVALECGFASSATFARSFQNMYSMSATNWRNGGYIEFSKNRKINSKDSKTKSKNGKEQQDFSLYVADELTGDNAIPVLTSLITRRNQMKNKSTLSTKVKVESLPEMHVAYVRHVGPYKGDNALFEGLWGRLMKWAGPRGFMEQPDLKCLCVYHDSPEITDETKLRTSVCITVPQDTEVDGEVGSMKIEGGKYAIGYFEIDPIQYQDAWNFMFGNWIPESGYQPDDRPAFEMFLNDPKEHPEHKHIINICVPVKPL